MSTMAGNLPGFEEAARALFRNDHDQLGEQIRRWPKDIRTHLARLILQSMRPDSARDAAAAVAEDK
jgi:hypothetical protein